MPEWVQQAGMWVAITYIVLDLTYKYAFKYIVWKAKRRNKGQFPEKMERRCNEVVSSNPGADTEIIVTALESLEKVLCLRLDAIQSTVTEIRKG